ncbi:MAG TPA: acetate--CoA ligase [Thermomicrobiales bacterium]|nr:acetate--CoA ligase [Thermomicrobiales bacterium]
MAGQDTTLKSTEPQEGIQVLSHEDRTFPPPEAFAKNANFNDPAIYERAAADPEAFWAEQAENLTWFKTWDQVLDWSDAPFAKWFVGGKLNVSYNCLDRHVEAGKGDKVAFHWEGEPGDQRTITYSDLLKEVCKLSNALTELDVVKGDRVVIYMPMIPELAVAMLACARIGAPHTVVFGGFSSDAVRDRINDAEAEIVITADGGYRRGAPSALKPQVDDAVEGAPSVEKVLVVKRTGQDVPMKEGRDFWYSDLVDHQPETFEPVEMDSEDLLYLLYTSGTTGKPKGIAHTTGGYLVGSAYTHKAVFDVKDDDIYWCAADIGWVTGHTYICYAPLTNGVTSVMYEGTPFYPAPDRWWDIVERYKVSILYCAPTAIRAHMKEGHQHAAKHDLSSLRLLGSVGEPINPEAWIWYHTHIGGERCPVVDTWWQTETGSIMISPLPGLTTTKPGSATKPLPGIDADIVDDNGESVPNGKAGYLVIKKPWPSMLRTVYHDPERYKSSYWGKFEGMYLAGDAAMRDDDGYIWLLGRTDDVMNVSGHRLSTMEIESALVSHDLVAEAAVVGQPDPLTGEAIFAFVILKNRATDEDRAALGKELIDHVAKRISPIAKPKRVMLTPDLPKTRSGKIMRRLLRDIASGQAIGDTTTLADQGVVNLIQEATSNASDDE